MALVKIRGYSVCETLVLNCNEQTEEENGHGSYKLFRCISKMDFWILVF